MKERVLVVDDDEGFRNLMVHHLTRQKFQVESASDGNEAIRVLRANGPYAVMITDVMMPGMSGLELLRFARRLDPYLEVIVITASGSMDAAISALREDGAYDLLTKPLEIIAELSIVVERAIAHRQLRLDRASLKDRLVRKAERLEALISSTNDAVISADAKGKIIVANPVATKLLGRDNLVGRDVNNALPERIKDMLGIWIASGAKWPAVIYMRWPADRMHAFKLTPVLAGNDTSDGWVMVIGDVTREKDTSTDNSQFVQEIADSMQTSIRRMVNILAKMARFSEFRQSALRRYLGQLAMGIHQLQDSVNRLHYVPIKGDKEKGQAGHAYLDSAFQVQIESYVSQLPSNEESNLVWKIPDTLPAINADPNLLQKSFQFLLGHMAKHTANGDEICLVAWESNGRVWVECSRPVSAVSSLAEDQEQIQLDKQSFWLRPDSEGIKIIGNLLSGQVWEYQEPSRNVLAICLPTAKGSGGKQE